jgi:hypothetical protein
MPIEALLWSLLLVLSPALAAHIWPTLRERLQALPFNLEALAPWIHALGLPYLALIVGSVSGRLMGLQGFSSASWFSGGLACAMGLGAAFFALSRIDVRPNPVRNLDLILQEETRWAFYRGAAAHWLRFAISPLLGFGLAVLELVITHLAKEGPHPLSSLQWKSVMRAAFSTLLFMATGNAWLTAGTQLLLTLLLVNRAQQSSTD